MKKAIRLIFCHLIYFAASFNLSAQELKTLGIKKLDKEFGITDSYFSDIVQDKRGIYWLSSLNGLTMFDGVKTRRFMLPFYKDKILESNVLSTLFFENDSTLWISNLQGVCRFNIYRHTFSPIPIKKEYTSQTLNFSVILRSPDGQIWLSTRERGLMYYDRQTGVIQNTDIAVLKDLARVRNITVLPSGKLLFCHFKGIILYNPQSGQVEDLAAEKSLTCLSGSEGTYSDAFLQQNILYASVRMLGDSYYSVISCSTSQKAKNLIPFRSNFGFNFYKDSEENIWLYHDGVNLIENKSRKLYNISLGRSKVFSMCYKIFEDLAKNIWFCTNDGLYVLESEKTVLENHSEIKSEQPVPHIYTEVMPFNQEIWLGTYGEGIVIHDSSLRFKKNIDLGKISGDMDFNNTGFFYISNKEPVIWVGCILGKFASYNTLSGKWKFYNDSIFHKQRIAAMQEDQEGNLYIGTNSGRIVKYDKSKEKFFLVYNELLVKEDAIDYISGFAFRGKDTLYISTAFNGLYRLNVKNNNIKSYKLDPEKNNSIKSNDLYRMMDFGQRGLFLGSTNGLLHFDPVKEKFTAYTPSEGAPFTEVYAMSLYEDNEVLCVTSDGLYSVDMEKRNARKIGRNSEADLINFSKAVYIPASKQIILGSDDYFYTLSYEKRPFTFIGKSFIYDLETTDTTYHFSSELPSHIKLDRNQNSFTLHFGSSGYKHADDLEFYYKLEGISDNWVYLASGRELKVNNLRGGDYTFRLRSVNKLNKQIVEEHLLPIHIKKYFYETAWFYVLIISLALLVLYIIYRVRLNKVLAIEKVRLKLSGDLHDDIGSTLSTINILSTIAGNKVYQDPESAGTYLRKISANTQDIMENMGDIVWSINPANDSITKVISKMREFATTILEPKDIKLELKITEELSQHEVKMEYRRDLYLIYKEALNNAAKYAQCTVVKVQLFIKQKHLVLHVEDNGVGFVPEESQSGNGLGSMGRRANAMGAILTINSKPGNGTQIRLDIPIRIIK